MEGGIKLLEKALTDESLCPIEGKKFKGMKMKDISAKDLDWLIGQNWLKYKYQSVYVYIKNNLDSIHRELEQDGGC